MAVAMISPEPTAYKQGGSNVEKINIDRGLLSKARTVLAFAPGHAANVLARTISLDQAYAEAKRQKATVQIGRLAAMAVAVIYPEPEERGRGRKGSVSSISPENRTALKSRRSGAGRPVAAEIP